MAEGDKPEWRPTAPGSGGDASTDLPDLVEHVVAAQRGEQVPTYPDLVAPAAGPALLARLRAALNEVLQEEMAKPITATTTEQFHLEYYRLSVLRQVLVWALSLGRTADALLQSPIGQPCPCATAPPSTTPEQQGKPDSPGVAALDRNEAPEVGLTESADQAPTTFPCYKGVRQRRWGTYVSEIRLPRKRSRIWLGSYDSAEKAALAYDTASKMLRGKQASRNIPHATGEVELPLKTLAALNKASKEAAKVLGLPEADMHHYQGPETSEMHGGKGGAAKAEQQDNNEDNKEQPAMRQAKKQKAASGSSTASSCGESDNMPAPGPSGVDTEQHTTQPLKAVALEEQGRSSHDLERFLGGLDLNVLDFLPETITTIAFPSSDMQSIVAMPHVVGPNLPDSTKPFLEHGTDVVVAAEAGADEEAGEGSTWYNYVWPS